VEKLRDERNALLAVLQRLHGGSMGGAVASSDLSDGSIRI